MTYPLLEPPPSPRIPRAIALALVGALVFGGFQTWQSCTAREEARRQAEINLEIGRALVEKSKQLKAEKDARAVAEARAKVRQAAGELKREVEREVAASDLADYLDGIAGKGGDAAPDGHARAP